MTATSSRNRYPVRVNLQKDPIWNGPNGLQLVSSMMLRIPVYFYWSIGDITETNSPYQTEVIIHGMERIGDYDTFDLRVEIKGDKETQHQHFRYSPTLNKGEILGTFDADHKAYEGRSWIR